MFIEPVNGSVKNAATLIRPELPAEEKPVSKGVSKVREGPVAEKKSDVSDMVKLAADVRKSLNAMHGVNMNFSIHEASGQVMVTISDEETKEVVREIPPSEFLNLAAKLDEMVGILFDQKV